MMTHYLPGIITWLPFIGFALLSLPLLLGIKPSEKTVNVTVGVTMLLQLAALSGLLVHFVWRDEVPERIVLGTWFEGDSHALIVEFFLDKMSALLLWCSSCICGVIGYFSTRYLHRDPGFHRFFSLFLLFVGAVSLVFTSANLDLLLVGWELVGLTSVLLIGFFQFRDAPPASSIYALVTYRLCDFALTAAILLSHAWTEKAHVSLDLPDLPLFPGASLSGYTAIAILMVIGCMGKSAQIPFSAWLSRAMEGPTPSSAVFYGAVSAHMGAFLLLRLSPIWSTVPFLSTFVVAVGVTTALYGAFAGRTRADAKSQLSFAAMAQLGLIFAEIGLGWHRFVICHIVGHSFVRTLQFLKAPSLLHEFHQMGASGKRFFRRSIFFIEQIIPENAQAWLYRQALSEAQLPSHIQNFLVRPVKMGVGFLDSAEEKWRSLFRSRFNELPAPEILGVDRTVSLVGSIALSLSCVGWTFIAPGIPTSPTLFLLLLASIVASPLLVLVMPREESNHGDGVSILLIQLVVAVLSFANNPLVVGGAWALAPLAVVRRTQWKDRFLFSLYQITSSVIFCGALFFRYQLPASPLAPVLFLLAIWIRMGAFPFHASILALAEKGRLASVVPFLSSQMGAIILVRFIDWSSLPIQTVTALGWTASIGALYFAVLALTQTQLRRLVVLVSLSGTSLGLCGLIHGNVSGTPLQWFSVAIFTAGLSATAWLVHARVGGAEGGLATSMPGLAVFFLLFGLGASGIPGGIGYVAGELMTGFLFTHHLSEGWVILAAAMVSVIAVYCVFARTFQGTTVIKMSGIDLLPRERTALVLLALALIVPALCAEPTSRWIEKQNRVTQIQRSASNKENIDETKPSVPHRLRARNLF